MSVAIHRLDETLHAKEELRTKYRPAQVRFLFVGEGPPASGRFFYQADSGLYRSMRDTFLKTFPLLVCTNFLESFRDLGCYLVDLCELPVDRLKPVQRKEACRQAEPRLSQIIQQLRPQAIVTLVLSIAPNVERAQHLAKWDGMRLALPYPGRWHQHILAFEAALTPFLAALRHDTPQLADSCKQQAPAIETRCSNPSDSLTNSVPHRKMNLASK